MREEWRTLRPVGGQYVGVREGVREALGKAGANVMGREGEKVRDSRKEWKKQMSRSGLRVRGREWGQT